MLRNEEIQEKIFIAKNAKEIHAEDTEDCCAMREIQEKSFIAKNAKEIHAKNAKEIHAEDTADCCAMRKYKRKVLPQRNTGGNKRKGNTRGGKGDCTERLRVLFVFPR